MKTAQKTQMLTIWGLTKNQIWWNSCTHKPQRPKLSTAVIMPVMQQAHQCIRNKTGKFEKSTVICLLIFLPWQETSLEWWRNGDTNMKVRNEVLSFLFCYLMRSLSGSPTSIVGWGSKFSTYSVLPHLCYYFAIYIDNNNNNNITCTIIVIPTTIIS